MSEIWNLSALCRCCHADGTFKNLQVPYVYEDSKEIYTDMLHDTLAIIMKPPQFNVSYTICDQCICSLRAASHFKQQVLDCERKFEEYCENELALRVDSENVKVELDWLDSDNESIDDESSLTLPKNEKKGKKLLRNKTTKALASETVLAEYGIDTQTNIQRKINKRKKKNKQKTICRAVENNKSNKVKSDINCDDCELDIKNEESGYFSTSKECCDLNINIEGIELNESLGSRAEAGGEAEHSEASDIKIGIKRKIDDQTKIEREKLGNSFKRQINPKGKEIVPKEFDESYECFCFKNCTVNVPLEKRKRIFEKFWSIGSYEGRCAFICENIRQTFKKRCYTKGASKRTFTRKYFFDDKEICKVTFLKTLQISQSRIDKAFEKTTLSSLQDLRGVVSGGINRTPESVVNKIMDHINLFVKQPNPYETMSKYLKTDMNLSLMYSLFKSAHTDGRAPSEDMYKKIYYEKFNLG